MIDMLIGLLIIWLIVWFVLQTSREKNVAKWKQRFKPVQPVVRVFVADVRATHRHARDFPERARTKRAMRRELREFRKLKEI